MAEQVNEGCLLDVDLLNWANQWVGKQCLRCGTEVNYVSLGMTDRQSEHRIECECTVIESLARG